MNAFIQQTPEWHELRKSKIGASDAPKIMNVGFQTPYQLWLEKLGLYEQEQNWGMKRGIEKEEEARQEFERQTGIIVFPDVVFSSEYEWMMASLDGIDIERKHIVEIKCPGKEDHECAMDGLVPEKYFPQLQHQMIVCNLDRAFYFSYSDKSSKVLEIYRDNDYNLSLIENEKKFIECLETLTPPKLTEKDFNYRDDDIWNETSKRWMSIQTRLRPLEKEEEEVRKLLIDMSGGLNVKGGGISLSKVVRKGNVEYKEIPELSKVNLDNYRKQNIVSFRISKHE